MRLTDPTKGAYTLLECPLPDGGGGRCSTNLHLTWTYSRPLYLGDLTGPRPIPVETGYVGEWVVVCEAGHALLAPTDLSKVSLPEDGGPVDTDAGDESRSFRASDVTRLRKVLGALIAGPRVAPESAQVDLAVLGAGDDLADPTTFAAVPSRVLARDEPCADPANCDVHGPSNSVDQNGEAT